MPAWLYRAAFIILLSALSLLPLGAGALVLLAFVHAALGESFSTGPAPRAAHLVRTGPYARIRHPMYLAIIGLLMSLRRMREEALLRERYGAEYLEYRQAVGAFLPRLRLRGAPGRGPALQGERPPARRKNRSPRKASARPG